MTGPRPRDRGKQIRPRPKPRHGPHPRSVAQSQRTQKKNESNRLLHKMLNMSRVVVGGRRGIVSLQLR